MAYMSPQKWLLQASVSRSLLRGRVCMQEFLPPPQLRTYVSRAHSVLPHPLYVHSACSACGVQNQHHCNDTVFQKTLVLPSIPPCKLPSLPSPITGPAYYRSPFVTRLSANTYIRRYTHTSIGILQFVSVSLPRSWLSPPSVVYTRYVYARTSPTCLSILYRGVQGTSLGPCCLYMAIQVHTYIPTYILYVIHNTTLCIHMYSVVGRSLAAGVSIRPLHHLLRFIPPRQCIKAVVWPTCTTVVYTYAVLSNE